MADTVTAAKLRYSRDELLASHAYARPHEEAGYRLHGGLDAEGRYVSPRTLVRWPAVRAWAKALEARGGALIDATTDLLARGNYPTIPQQKLLLAEGLGRTFWNSLTVTGVIEARGRMLAQFTAPDVQRIVDEDLSEMATGHLNAGLLYAHGVDEGGDPADPKGPGAHDQMWFAARDLAFGKGAFPDPELPGNISRPAEGREMPQLPEPYENLFKLLMNVLMIEVRAEAFFAFCCDLLNDPDAFPARRAEAAHAAVLVDRIRTDEAIHVAYLQVVISELRTLTFRTVDGARVKGAAILDPVWEKMVRWHGREERELGRARTRAEIERQFAALRGEAEGKALFARFDALEAA